MAHVWPTLSTEREISSRVDALHTELKRLRKRPKRGAPATVDAVAALEKQWGRPLPASYRAFLNAADGLVSGGDVPLLVMWSTAQMAAESRTGREAKTWQRADPDCAEALRGFVIGREGDGFVLLDPGASGRDEAIVVVDSEYDVTRHASLVAYFDARLEACRGYVSAVASHRAAVRRDEELRASDSIIEGFSDAAIAPSGAIAATLGTTITLWDLAGAKESSGKWWARRLRAFPYGEGIYGDAVTEPPRISFDASGAVVAVRTLSRAGAIVGVRAWRVDTGAEMSAADGIPPGRDAEPGALGAEIVEAAVTLVREGGRVGALPVSGVQSVAIAADERHVALVDARSTQVWSVDPIAKRLERPRTAARVTIGGRWLIATNRFRPSEGLALVRIG